MLLVLQMSKHLSEACTMTERGTETRVQLWTCFSCGQYSRCFFVMLAKYDSRAHFGPAIKQWGQVGGRGRGGVTIEVGMSGSIIGLALSVISGKALFCNSLSNDSITSMQKLTRAHTHLHGNQQWDRWWHSQFSTSDGKCLLPFDQYCIVCL